MQIVCGADRHASGKIQIHTPSPRELAEFKRVLLATHAEMAERIGPSVISAIYAETGFDRTQLKSRLK